LLLLELEGLFVVVLGLTDVLLLLTLLLLVTGLTEGLVGGLVVIREDDPGLVVVVFDRTTLGVVGVFVFVVVVVFGKTGAGVEGGRLEGLLGVLIELLLLFGVFVLLLL